MSKKFLEKINQTLVILKNLELQEFKQKVEKVNESIVAMSKIDGQEVKQGFLKVKESIVDLGKIEQDVRKGIVTVNRFMKNTNYIVPKVLIPVIAVPIAIKTYNKLLAPATVLAALNKPATILAALNKPATVLVALNKPPIVIPPNLKTPKELSDYLTELLILNKSLKKSVLWQAIRRNVSDK
jgi:hypothetical protein